MPIALKQWRYIQGIPRCPREPCTSSLSVPFSSTNGPRSIEEDTSTLTCIFDCLYHDRLIASNDLLLKVS